MTNNISKMTGVTKRLDIHNPVAIIKKIVLKNKTPKIKCEIFGDVENISDDNCEILLTSCYSIRSSDIPFSIFWEYDLEIRFNEPPNYKLNFDNILRENKEITLKLDEMIDYIDSLVLATLPKFNKEE